MKPCEMVFETGTRGGCKEHPHDKQSPGVCSSCLRENSRSYTAPTLLLILFVFLLLHLLLLINLFLRVVVATGDHGSGETLRWRRRNRVRARRG